MTLAVFDLYDLFVNQLIGSPVLFMIIATIVIIFAATKVNMNNDVMLFTIAVFGILTSIAISNFLPFIIAIGFSFVGWTYSRWLSRG